MTNSLPHIPPSGQLLWSNPGWYHFPAAYTAPQSHRKPWIKNGEKLPFSSIHTLLRTEWAKETDPAAVAKWVLLREPRAPSSARIVNCTSNLGQPEAVEDHRSPAYLSSLRQLDKGAFTALRLSTKSSEKSKLKFLDFKVKSRNSHVGKDWKIYMWLSRAFLSLSLSLFLFVPFPPLPSSNSIKPRGEKIVGDYSMHWDVSVEILCRAPPHSVWRHEQGGTLLKSRMWQVLQMWH